MGSSAPAPWNRVAGVPGTADGVFVCSPRAAARLPQRQQRPAHRSRALSGCHQTNTHPSPARPEMDNFDQQGHEISERHRSFPAVRSWAVTPVETRGAALLGDNFGRKSHEQAETSAMFPQPVLLRDSKEGGNSI